MPLRLTSTLAVAVALKRSLLPSFTAATGLEPEVTWNPTTVILQRIEEGLRADAIILIDGPMADLAARGIVDASTVCPIATAKIGVAVAGDAAPPPLATVADLRAALLSARSVAYSRTGASGIHFAKLIERMGIGDAINAKATVIPEGFTAAQVVAGTADLAIQQLSELMSVDGIRIVGPLPEEVQSGTDFSVAAYADADNPVDAARLIAHLTSPEAAAAYESGGLTSRLPRP